MTTEAREPKVDSPFLLDRSALHPYNRDASTESGPPYVMAV